jgi:hypothetical protein
MQSARVTPRNAFRLRNVAAEGGRAADAGSSPDPEMLFVSKSGLTVAIYDRDQPPSPDEIPMREALVSFLHIAATEDLPQPTSKAG